MSTGTPNMDALAIEAVRSVVLRTGLLLDGHDLTGWLALFESDGVYELRAYSTEIRQWMTWWLATRVAMSTKSSGSASSIASTDT